MTRRRALIAALGILVASLIFGSVRTTGALWARDSDTPDGQFTTGRFGISADGGSGQSFTFGLGKNGVVVDETVSAPLTITNIGTPPISFQVTHAGPAVSTAGAAVQVDLSATVGGCDTTGVTAFSVHGATSTGSTATGSPRPLAPGAAETWCVHAVLKSASGTSPASYRIVLTFRADQTLA
ncbi:hypothetical protein [Gordonia humi]|uniref:Uncharacterized protein n=1 Tax=Gordonia humi TaxID=686429 RepID=A0A840F6K0_9ACTN|nr:hypothetical protein [Gordonia humi]MBB4137179.1 hypothetical protein [Gordonia humi]